MRALAKHGSLKEAQRSGLRLARQDSPAMKQSILRADAPPPGRPGASLATLTGLAAYLSRGGGIAAELRKKKGRHVLHSDLGLQKYRDERRRVKPRPRRVRQRRAEAQGTGAHLEEEGAVYDRVYERQGHEAAVKKV